MYRLKIQNFGKHKNLEIEFDNFQILTAENGMGKSTIFHAINWLINGGTNKLISNGSNSSMVSFEFGTDKLVRACVKNDYTLTLNGNLICSTKDSLEKLNINLPIKYFSQFDKIFLLTETPKAKADILNSMFEIEKLELGSSNIKKDIKDKNNYIKELENKLEKDTSSLNKITDIENKLSEEVFAYESINNVYEKLLKLNTKYKEVKNIPNKINKDVDTSILNKIQVLYHKYNSLINIPNKINKEIDCVVLNKLIKIKELMNSLNKIPDKINKNVDSFSYIKLDRIKNKYIEINDNILSINELKLEMQEMNNKLRGVECPLCKKKI